MEKSVNILKAYYAKQLEVNEDAAFILGITKNAEGISEAEKVLYGIMQGNGAEQGLIPFGEFHLLPPGTTSIRCQGAITISRLQRVKDGDFDHSPFNLSYATKYGCGDKGLPEKMKRGFLREFFKGIERDGKEILPPAYDLPSTAFDTATGYLFKGSQSGKLAIDENTLFAKEAYDPNYKGTPLPTWVLSLSEETVANIASDNAIRARIRQRRQALAQRLGAQFGEQSFELIYTGLISIMYFERKPQPKRDDDGKIIPGTEPLVDYEGSGKLQIYSPYGIVYARPVKHSRRGRERKHGIEALMAAAASMPAGKRLMYTPGEEGLDAAFADPSGFYSGCAPAETPAQETTETTETTVETNTDITTPTTAAINLDFDALTQEMLDDVIAAQAEAEAAKAEVEALKAQLTAIQAEAKADAEKAAAKVASLEADNVSLQTKVEEQAKEMASMKRSLITDEELGVIKKVVAIFASDEAN